MRSTSFLFLRFENTTMKIEEFLYMPLRNKRTDQNLLPKYSVFAHR